MVAELKKYNALGSDPQIPIKFENESKDTMAIDPKSIGDKVIVACEDCGLRTLFKPKSIQKKCVFCRKSS